MSWFADFQVPEFLTFQLPEFELSPCVCGEHQRAVVQACGHCRRDGVQATYWPGLTSPFWSHQLAVAGWRGAESGVIYLNFAQTNDNVGGCE